MRLALVARITQDNAHVVPKPIMRARMRLVVRAQKCAETCTLSACLHASVSNAW